MVSLCNSVSRSASTSSDRCCLAAFVRGAAAHAVGTAQETSKRIMPCLSGSFRFSPRTSHGTSRSPDEFFGEASQFQTLHFGGQRDVARCEVNDQLEVLQPVTKSVTVREAGEEHPRVFVLVAWSRLLDDGQGDEGRGSDAPLDKTDGRDQPFDRAARAVRGDFVATYHLLGPLLERHATTPSQPMRTSRRQSEYHRGNRFRPRRP